MPSNRNPTVLTLGLQDTTDTPSEYAINEDDLEDDDNNGDDDVMSILLQSIKDIIDRLLRLATKLRSPEARLRSSRAQNFRIIDDGVDLFTCFVEYEYDYVSSVFKHYRRGIKLVGDTESATAPGGDWKFHVDDEASNYLIMRIALANIARRRQFAYWRNHHLKLQKHTEAALAAREDAVLTNEIYNLSAPSRLPPTKSLPAMTISTATQLLNPTQNFDDLTSVASVSEYMPSAVGQHADVVNFPRPPYTDPDAKFFECPYCFTTCARKTSKLKAWQAHLVHDLRPYICTYEDCRTADQLYDSKIDWIEHETANHATTWQCPIHPNEVFDDLVSFRLHAADGHIQHSLIEGRAEAVTTRELTDKTRRSCPICTVSGISAAQLNDHIAAHLERLAIFSLPQHVGMSEADEDVRGSDEANEDVDSRGLDLESDISFNSTPRSILGQDYNIRDDHQPSPEEDSRFLSLKEGKSQAQDDPKPDEKPPQPLVPANRPVFGMGLSELFRRDGTAVPTIVYKCIQAIDLYGLTTEGIYRTPGQRTMIQSLRSQFQHDFNLVDLTKQASFGYDISNVTSLLLDFLAGLPDPLLTTKASEDFKGYVRHEDLTIRRDGLHFTINNLPDANYATLRVLILHLDRVASHSHTNKMDMKTLAQLLGPTLMGEVGGSAGTLIAEDVLETILMNTYQIFDPDEEDTAGE